MVLLSAMQKDKLAILNNKINIGETEEQCQLWLQSNLMTLALLKEEEELDFGDNWSAYPSPVHTAVFTDRPGIIRMFHYEFEINLNVMIKFTKGNNQQYLTAMHLAVSLNNLNMVQLLLEFGVNQFLHGKTTNHNGTALDWARKRNESPEIIQLLSNAATRHQTNDVPQVPLMEIDVGEPGPSNPNVQNTEQSNILGMLDERSSKHMKLEQALKVRADIAREEQEWKVDLRYLQQGHDDRIRALKNHPHYLSEEEILCLSREISQNVSDMKQELKKSKNKEGREENNDIECVICLDTPKDHIFLCGAECETLMCESCKNQLRSCSVCRVSFTSVPPRRSRAFERLLKKNR